MKTTSLLTQADFAEMTGSFHFPFVELIQKRGDVINKIGAGK